MFACCGNLCKSYISSFKDIATGDFGDEKTTKKQKKKQSSVTLVENEAFSGETFHKKNEVLKKMLEDIFNVKTMTTQLEMELEITKILNYFLDLRTDFLLTNLKHVFVNLVNEK